MDCCCCVQQILALQITVEYFVKISKTTSRLLNLIQVAESMFEPEINIMICRLYCIKQTETTIFLLIS